MFIKFSERKTTFCQRINKCENAGEKISQQQNTRSAKLNQQSFTRILKIVVYLCMITVEEIAIIKKKWLTLDRSQKKRVGDKYFVTASLIFAKGENGRRKKIIKKPTTQQTSETDKRNQKRNCLPIISVLQILVNSTLTYLIRRECDGIFVTTKQTVNKQTTTNCAKVSLKTNTNNR